MDVTIYPWSTEEANDRQEEKILGLQDERRQQHAARISFRKESGTITIENYSDLPVHYVVVQSKEENDTTWSTQKIIRTLRPRSLDSDDGDDNGPSPQVAISTSFHAMPFL